MAASDQDLVGVIEQKKVELERAPITAAVFRALKQFTTEVTEIRFLAVGNFGLEDLSAEYQTALTLILQAHFDASVTAWDPNFKKRDIRVLSELGIRVVAKDPKPSDTVLWFVPHAPYFLEPELLGRVRNNVYIGNDLTLEPENTTRETKLVEPYKAKASIVSLKVKPKDPYREAFKNTAVHKAE